MKKLILLISLVCWVINPANAQHTAPNYITINEIKTVGTDNPYDEFVELFNVSDSSFNVGNYQLIYYHNDDRPCELMFTFPESTFIAPYHYYLLATTDYSETKPADATMANGLLSNGQLLLMDSTKTDTLDAVAWGIIDSIITNERQPAKYIVSVGGPPVSPELWDVPCWSIQRNPEGTDTNNNLGDFQMRNFTTPMNSSDSLKLILPNSLRASIRDEKSIEIQWRTLSRTKDLHFLIYQKVIGDSNWNIIDPGSALSFTAKKDTLNYRFIQSNIDVNLIYQYKIKEMDFTQHPRFTETVTVGANDIETITAQPKYFSLAQNYPNPFNSGTNISYAIYEEGRIALAIFNIHGQKIKTLFDEIRKEGDYSIAWNGTDSSGKKVPSGEYFYVLKHGNSSQCAKKMLVLK